MARKRFITGLLITIFAVALIFILSSQEKTSAGSGQNVSGWAWSSNIGWISFNDLAPGSGGGSYGVNVDSAGNISGYAWSNNIGWISFNAGDVSGCPQSPCAPTLNKTNGQISGWAKALNGSAATGWDGFIRLRGQAADGSPYGVDASIGSPCAWTGWAWGSSVVGWISFNGSGYGVTGSGDACRSAPPKPLAVSCSGSPNPAGLNQTVTWSSLVAGGTAPYSYSWSGTNALSGSTQTVTKAYTTPGTKNATVTVTDSGSPAQSQFGSCSIKVKTTPKIIEIKP